MKSFFEYLIDMKYIIAILIIIIAVSIMMRTTENYSPFVNHTSENYLTNLSLEGVPFNSLLDYPPKDPKPEDFVSESNFSKINSIRHGMDVTMKV
jgi:hypothetical protein